MCNRLRDVFTTFTVTDDLIALLQTSSRYILNLVEEEEEEEGEEEEGLYTLHSETKGKWLGETLWEFNLFEMQIPLRAERAGETEQSILCRHVLGLQLNLVEEEEEEEGEEEEGLYTLHSETKGKWLGETLWEFNLFEMQIPLRAERAGETGV
ncbi:hypothetical protein F2P81_015980 [Scophthalmus maximus]|uniref:Uncharacterized protein n=1 Tax=Scophthalmus maximus TaxID=52904 RepID=A0A6A4SFR2_SCOMX|nr:hypothetical protein F2P81_015980 [Scophthalmus maximus]